MLRSVAACAASTRMQWRSWLPRLTTIPHHPCTEPHRSLHSCTDHAHVQSSCLSSASPLLPHLHSPHSPRQPLLPWSLPSLTTSSSPSSLMAPIDSLALPRSPLSFPLFPSPFPLSAPLECAVPKRKPSPRAQRHRRAGQRAIHLTRRYVNYRVCLNCGAAVKPHYLCNRCRQVIGRF